MAQTPADYSIQLYATTQTSPPQIKIGWKKIAGISTYTVYRKSKTAATFGSPIATLGVTDSLYADNSVVLDSAYEYQVLGGSTASGYIYAGIKNPAIHDRGSLLLLVDTTFADSCAAEILMLMSDIRGDGWKVVKKIFKRPETVPNVKSYITTSYNADNTIRAVLILGHIAVPYSGNIYPDGHPDHEGAWPADVYYGDINGTWTDISINNTVASRTQNDNIPGDGKFDQSNIPSDIDLQVSRIDFYDMSAFGKTEVQLMKSYLNRNHTYKTDSLTMIHRAVIDDNFGLSTTEPFAANGWRNFAPLLGSNNVQSADYLTSLNGGTYQWSYGCGPGSYTSAGGVATTSNFTTNNINGIFTMLFGSYFGDWDIQNSFLRAPLCANVPALTNCWAGRPHWFFHHMALGENIGYSTILSQNNSTLYQASNDYGTRFIHNALMGDLTLRADYMKPVSNVVLTPITGAGAKITWAASPDPGVIGYYVYRSDAEFGMYEKRSALVNITNYTDSYGTDGLKYYMVRAVKLQNTTSGGYYNLSLGVVSAPATITYPSTNIASLYHAWSDISISPNPAHHYLNLSFNATCKQAVSVSITDLTGRILSTKTIKTIPGNNSVELDIADIPNGLNELTLQKDGNIETVKWIKY